MTPKEKAEQLFYYYYNELKEQLFYYYYNELKEHKDIYYIKTSKQCALIAVEEILNIGCVEVPYWHEVKTEIENL